MAIKKCFLALLLFALLLSLGYLAQADDNDGRDYDDNGNDNDDNGDDDGEGDDHNSNLPGGNLPGANIPGTFRKFNRHSFPDGFIFGAGSSAYQVEGAADKRGKNVWDTFTKNPPPYSPQDLDASVACDQYHRYKEDLEILNDMGFDSYRFSISWTRILPKGKRRFGINRDGVEYYNNLINEVIKRGMKPFVTLFHWDLPQYLEDEYGGFRSRSIIDDITDYADICFTLFGDRVKNWVTLNEPWVYSTMGYTYGTFPPNRCSAADGDKQNKDYGSLDRFANLAPQDCAEGNSGTEPYIVTHNQLLAHASIVKLYREKYKSQGGQIGITLNSKWYEPFNPNKDADKSAANRAFFFVVGWYLDPITVGSYPREMKLYVDDRLPVFNETETAMLKGSYDFIGINYYTIVHVKDIPCETHKRPSYLTDPCFIYTDGTGISAQANNFGGIWPSYPQGLGKLLTYIKSRYKNPPVFITENGLGRRLVGYRPRHLHDRERKNYHVNHLRELYKTINDLQVNVAGYFVWSFTDNFEWLDGFNTRFGLLYVDFNQNKLQTLERHCKDSAKWFAWFLGRNGTAVCNKLGSL